MTKEVFGDEWFESEEAALEAIERWKGVTHSSGGVWNMMAGSVWTIGFNEGFKNCTVDNNSGTLGSTDDASVKEEAQRISSKTPLLTAFPPAIFCDVWRSAYVAGYFLRKNMYFCPHCGREIDG